MILIADAGGSKTDWRLIDEDKIHQFESDGFNWKTHPLEPFIANLPLGILELKNVGELHFYGAGIVNELDVASLRERLQKLFPDSDVFCYSDTLGVARSLFGRDKGYACIIGTGSGAAYYDGNTISSRIPSLGYILGDEGSGFAMGKSLLSAKFRDQLPERLSRKFELSYPRLTESDLLNHVYKEPKANLYVAGFASFLIENQSDPFAYGIIEEQLTDFFQSYFPDREANQKLRFRFCGSVAHYTSNILRRVAVKFNASVDLTAQSPIAGLTLYHKQND